MFSWLSQTVNGSKPNDPQGELKSLMIEALSFDAVLSSAKQLEYKHCLEQICRYSFDSEDRAVVMDFLHYSFAPVEPDREWRKTFNGLRILNQLIDSGSRVIFTEVSEGRHFDILQKTLFLTNYHNTDERVGKLVRSSAKEIRDKLLEKFNEEIPEIQPEDIKSISYRDIVPPNIVCGNTPPGGLASMVRFGHTEDDSDEDVVEQGEVGDLLLVEDSPPMVQIIQGDVLDEPSQKNTDQLLDLITDETVTATRGSPPTFPRTTNLIEVDNNPSQSNSQIDLL